jgi:hypothetical protein
MQNNAATVASATTINQAKVRRVMQEMPKRTLL